MREELICVVCPNGCEIAVEKDEAGNLAAVFGAMCPRGEAYARREAVCPMRTVSSSVLVAGGEAPLCSVRLSAPVPLKEMGRVMEAIRAARLTAPVRAGETVIADVAGLGADVIATRSVGRA